MNEPFPRTDGWLHAEAVPLAVPFCTCQIVLRQALYANAVIMDENPEESSSDRGSGGFGSTGPRIGDS